MVATNFIFASTISYFRSYVDYVLHIPFGIVFPALAWFIVITLSIIVVFIVNFVYSGGDGRRNKLSFLVNFVMYGALVCLVSFILSVARYKYAEINLRTASEAALGLFLTISCLCIYIDDKGNLHFSWKRVFRSRAPRPSALQAADG